MPKYTTLGELAGFERGSQFCDKSAPAAAPVRWPDFAARRRAVFGDTVFPAGTAAALVNEDREAVFRFRRFWQFSRVSLPKLPKPGFGGFGSSAG